eukprot:7919974-Pyramimonas_sp.AAC.1
MALALWSSSPASRASSYARAPLVVWLVAPRSQGPMARWALVQGPAVRGGRLQVPAQPRVGALLGPEAGRV